MNRVVLGLLAGALILHSRPAAAQVTPPQPYGADPYGPPAGVPPGYTPPGAPSGGGYVAPPQQPPFGNPPYAGPQDQPPVAAGFHTHDGFFLQLNGGYGGLGSEASEVGVSAKVSGTGSMYSIAIGGALSENFVVAGNLWGMAVSEPRLEVNGVSGTATGGAYAMSGLGVNFTYYLMPANLYFSVVPSFAAIGLNNGRGTGTATTKSGFAFRLAAGKEWWVSDNWGLGLNLQYAHSSNIDEGQAPSTWTTNWFGVAFSATYN